MAVDREAAEEGLAELMRIYRDAERIVAQQVRIALIEGRLEEKRNRQNAYNAIEQYLKSVGIEADPIAKKLIENAWREGDQSVIRAAHPEGVGFNFDLVNRGAMEEMQKALLDNLDGARKTVGRQVNDVFRRAGLRAAALGQLGARGSVRSMSQELVKDLEKQGVKSFINRAGARYDLKDYAKMVARTTTREAVVAAQASRMADFGIEYARVSMNGSKCEICGPQEGVLVSIGTGRALEGEQAASLDALPNGGPPFHPNCRHWLDPESTMFSDRGSGSGSSGSSGGSGGGGTGSSGSAGAGGTPNMNVTIGPNVRPQAVKSSKSAIDSIAKVHDPAIKVEIRHLRSNASANANYDGYDFWSNVKADVNPFSVVHELGHGIDHQVFGNKASIWQGGNFGTQGKINKRQFAQGVDNAKMQAWWNAIVDSGVEQAVTADRTLAGATSYKKYLLSPIELWARSYAQWIATRSGAEDLLERLEALRNGQVYGMAPSSQWSDADFLPIAQELDKLLLGGPK